MNAANEYLLLEKYILAARAEGSLRAEVEVGLVDRMESLWLSMSDEETAEADARALRTLLNGCRCHGQGECAWCVQRNADNLLEPLGET